MVSVIQACSWTSVIPGSLSLRSVHSGVYRGMRARASATRSWNRRRSRSGGGRGITRSSRRALVEVERVDDVGQRVVGADPVVDLEQQRAGDVGLGGGA